MSWNYRIFQTDYDMFEIVEAYYNDSGIIDKWCVVTNSVLCWNNIEDLKGTIRYLQGAVDKPVLIKKGQQLINLKGDVAN